MIRLIVILAVAGLLYILYKKIQKLDKEKRNNFIKLLAVGVVIFMLLGLALSGRLNWLVALFGAIISILPRLYSWVARLWPLLMPALKIFRKNKMAKAMMVETLFLNVAVDRVTGEIKATITQGELKDKSLSDLNIDELMKLLKDYQHKDMASAEVVASYLDQRHQGWRQGNNYKDKNESQVTMSKDEARAILDVKKDASQQDIITAYKRLMQKLHPDRGGSIYLAKKINQAKDILVIK